jgi:hypothetical protein
MKIWRSTSLIILLLLAFSQANGQSFSTPVKVNSGASGTEETDPTMHVTGNGTIYVSWYDINQDIYFSRSIDGGLTFAPKISVTKHVENNIYETMFQRSPKFAVDTKGVIHMVWTEARVKAQTDVWYVNSTDNGQTWSMPKSIMDPDDSQKYAQDFVAIACDSSDRLYVSFLDFRMSARKVSTNAQLFMLRSLDGGATWSNAIKANNMPGGIGGTCECCKQDIVASPSGNLYIGFRSNIKNKRDIFIARSRDRGTTWDPIIQAQLGDWMIQECPVTGPNLVLDNKENLHIAWRDQRDAVGRDIVYYTMLRKGDTAVFPNRAISSLTNQAADWPDIGATDNGVLFSIYQSNDLAKELRFTFSSDGGNSWTPNATVVGTNSSQEFANVEYDKAGNFYMLWKDTRNDAGDIYFSKVTKMPAPVAPPQVTILNKKIIDPSKQKLIWHLPQAYSDYAWFDVRLLNVTAIEADSIIGTRDTTWISKNVQGGVLHYSITAHTLTGSSTIVDSVNLLVTGGVSDRTAAAQTLQLFPNPISANATQTTLAFHQANMGKATIFLTDDLGRSVLEAAKTFVAGDQSWKLELNNLPPGLYECILRHDGVDEVAKLVLAH